MASDRSKFTTAQKKWDLFQSGKQFSEENAVAAVLWSGYARSYSKISKQRELEAFEADAYAVAERLEKTHIFARVLGRFSLQQAIEVIQEPVYSSVVVIGNGNLSRVIIDRDNDLDWVTVSRASTHLKTGIFMQRQCGNFSRDFNLPLGHFVMKSQSQVLAAPKKQFPARLSAEDEEAIQPVHQYDRIDFETAKILFPPRKSFECLMSEASLASKNDDFIMANVD